MLKRILALAFAASTIAFSKPPGASLPPPRLPLQQPPTTLVMPKELKTLETFFNDTSFIVKASVANTDVFDHTYIAPGYGTNLSGNETKIRIASITKLFTALALIISEDKISWEASIKNFVPELEGDVWDDVTIGALAGHTSGLGVWGHVGDLSTVPRFKASLLGLPVLTAEEVPRCDQGPVLGNRECTYDEIIAMFNDPSQLPHSPNSGPLYSNIGYNLLGMALAKVHGKPYEEVIKELIFDPLGMSASTFDTPNNDEYALLPRPGDQWFNLPFGNYNPTGGIWTTPNELERFMRAIQHHELISAAKTRKWMQPRSFTNNVHELVGAPWEIHRWTDLDLAYKRPIDIYTKSGGVKGYAGYGILIPEYDLTITVNAAGSSSDAAAKKIMNFIIQRLVPYYDRVAKLEAETFYAGNYTSTAGSDTMVELGVDEGPGLIIKKFSANGIALAGPLWKILGIHRKDLSLRLYPTDPDSMTLNGKQYWRMHISSIKAGFAEEAWQKAAPAWMDMDRFRYGGQPIDSVNIIVKNGNAVAIELLGWRATLVRQT